MFASYHRLAAMAAASLAVIVPALAVAREAPPVPVANASSAKAEGTRYCVVGPITGSLLPSRECRRRAEWLALGFDPLRPAK